MLLRQPSNILAGALLGVFCLFNSYVSTSMKIRGMFLYFSALTSMSAKGAVVPGHIGCLHVYKVNINPEIDTKGNRLMRSDINSEQDACTGVVSVLVTILHLLINLYALWMICVYATCQQRCPSVC